MRGRRRSDADEDQGWLRLQGRTNARLHLLARELGADFVAPDNWDTFAVVRGQTGGCRFELRIVRDPSDAARTGVIRHGLELEIEHGATRATRTLSGEGLTPPNLDPHRVRSALEAHCYSFMSRSDR
ncbi:MAG: hypothetical protein ACT4OX_03990 [Actinomycetota bacterium]